MQILSRHCTETNLSKNTYLLNKGAPISDKGGKKKKEKAYTIPNLQMLSLKDV